MTKQKDVGNHGEQIACKYLEDNGYVIVQKNYYESCGEIDIIAENADFVVFAEVKTRDRNYIFRPSEAVTVSKQRKIIKTAQYYLLENEKGLQPRFDVIEIVTASKNDFHVLEIEHIEDAFGV